MTKLGVVGNGVVRDSVATPCNDVNKMLTICSGGEPEQLAVHRRETIRVECGVRLGRPGRR